MVLATFAAHRILLAPHQAEILWFAVLSYTGSVSHNRNTPFKPPQPAQSLVTPRTQPSFLRVHHGAAACGSARMHLINRTSCRDTTTTRRGDKILAVGRPMCYQCRSAESQSRRKSKADLGGNVALGLFCGALRRNQSGFTLWPNTLWPYALWPYTL